jgi:hypothetical protein
MSSQATASPSMMRERERKRDKGVRLLGVSLSSLCADVGDVDPQMTLEL